MDSGWVKLQGSTPGSRDTYILNHEGSVWSNYHMETRFNALGGGDDWSNADVMPSLGKKQMNAHYRFLRTLLET